MALGFGPTRSDRGREPQVADKKTKHLLHRVNFRDPSSGDVVTFGPGDDLPAYASEELDKPQFRSYWTDNEKQSQVVARSLHLAAELAAAQAEQAALIEQGN